MVGAEVQGVEVIPLGFHFRPRRNLPAHRDEEVLDILHKPRQRVARAQGLTADRQRHVNRLGGEGALLLLSLNLLLLGAKRAPEIGAQLAHEFAGFLLLVGGERANSLARLRHCRFRTRILGFDGFQFLRAGGFFDLPDAFVDRCGHRLCIEYRALCHEYPFLFQ